MATKNPTLASYTEPQLDVRVFKPAYDDAPVDFYEMLYDECERVGELLIQHIPVTPTKNGYVLKFGDASFTDFENVIADDPDVVLPALVSACHMTERIVREHVGVKNLYQHATPDAEIRGCEPVQEFIARGCQEYLVDDVPLETVLFLYFRSQERNRVQHARGSFFKDVHVALKDNGFAVVKDESAPGRPNFIVNASEPVELTSNSVAGKALKAKPNDVPKRARLAASRCGDIAEQVPGAKRVLVFKISGEPFPNDRVREKQRAKIHDQNREAIDAVFFEDELDEFIEYCDEHITVFGKNAEAPGAREESDASLDAWG